MGAILFQQIPPMQTKTYQYIAVMCLLLAFVVGALSSLGIAQNIAPTLSKNERSLATVMRDRIPMDKLGSVLNLWY